VAALAENHQRCLGTAGNGDNTEVIVERDAQPVAIIRPAEPVRRKIYECIALLPRN
jgi:hypothetical protein